MEIKPQSVEEMFKVEKLKRQLSELNREELEEFTKRLLTISSKLTHQTKQLLARVIEFEGKSY
jgi:hypothetical protein